MRNESKTRLLAMVEGALMVALTVVLDLLPLPSWPQGGSITVAMIPVIYYSYRRGARWGIGAGFVYSLLQMLLGFYIPPAGTWWALLLCVVLDYLLAFTVVGMIVTICAAYPLSLKGLKGRSFFAFIIMFTMYSF